MASRILPPFSFILILLVILEPSHSLHPNTNNASDEQALMAFNSAIEYDQTNSFISWTSKVSFCRWKGVTCSLRRQRVVSLNLSSVGLEGTLSPYLGNLSFLRILDLSYNNLHGSIPYQLGRLPRLRKLILSSNQLEGPIPTTLGSCSLLRNISLRDNHLTGSIPSELGFLPNLEYIQLGRNNLTGRIPNSLGNISSLYFLDLQENKLGGHIPWEFGMLPKLNILSFQFNHLTGEIPSSLSNCTTLRILSVVDNHLDGEIPRDLCTKDMVLTGLYLGMNRFSGSIPVTLSNCSQLQRLALEENQLSGVVPTELGKLSRLAYLGLIRNQFVSGSTTSLPIITALTNCSHLQYLQLGYNHLAGVVPSSVGKLSAKLGYLFLGVNKLRGRIPPQIGNLTNLYLLDLEGNLFTGAIPSSVGMLQRMQELYLGSNNLQASIPKEIGQLKSLGVLALQQNKLSGNIPNSFAQVQQIRYLFLEYNVLTGSIPPSLGECKTLEVLDLSYNRLGGHIPPQVAGLSNMAIYFNLSNNLLQGPLPSELSKMDKVQAIDISANHLTGYIPSAIVSCVALEYLNLSFNELQGPIPVSLDKLQNLQDLDFSTNNLSGRIPISLGKLKLLKHINFSTNKLSGEVPKDGVFKKLGAEPFIGNPNLCGLWVKLPPCPTLKHKSPGHFKRIVIPIGITAFVTCCLIMVFLWRQCCERYSMFSPFELGPKRISFQELLAASNGFSEANLLGVGSFGKVFRGALKDGTLVAIKVLNMQNEDAHKIFDRECNVLRRVRHRNLVRIITCYSDPDFKALIFPLLPKGSLHNFLYPEGEPSSQGQVCRLDLIQRMGIALDIAQGMEYLHHHCFVQVVHCDLKPGNVLLGEDMTAYLIDFGISKLCFGNSGDSCTSTCTLMGSIGYIAPEYGVGGPVTTKGDVYSYGIILLEMVTGKKPTNNIFLEGLNLQNWVKRCFPNTIVEVVDSYLLSGAANNDEDKVLECLKQVIYLGLLCAKESPEERPSMVDVVKILRSIKDKFVGASSTTFPSDISHLLAGSTSAVGEHDKSNSSSF